MNNNKKSGILFLILGLIGLGITGYFMVNSYFNSKTIKELLIPVAIGFLPFFMSFALLRLGIGKLINKKQ